jgi:hypothetical protein
MEKNKMSRFIKYYLIKYLFISSLILTFFAAPVTAEQEGASNAAEVQKAFYNIIATIEEAAGLEPKASILIANMSDEAVEEVYGSLENQEQLIISAQQIMDRVESTKVALAEKEVVPTEKLDSNMLELSSTGSFPPNYPSTQSTAYAFLSLLGLIDSVDDRCGGDGFENYKSALVGAEKAMVVADSICTVVACDPTGIGCAIYCGAVKVAELAVLTARLPIDACKEHEGGVDSAETEAGFENSVSILNDLAANDSAIKDLEQQLSTHDSDINQQLSTHDSDIKQQISDLDATMNQRLDQVEAQLEKIIRLLRTPQGRRPGWNERE